MNKERNSTYPVLFYQTQTDNTHKNKISGDEIVKEFRKNKN